MENISDYAMRPWYKSIQDSVYFMFSDSNEFVQESFEKYQKQEFEEGNLKGYNLTEENVYECENNNVKFEGRLIGGCLDAFS